MSDRDELVFLLHTASEIEHMLMVQYLYAAYSTADTPLGTTCHDELALVARQEMGHLLCLQNMLVALGAPLNFERQDYPFSALYPFGFRLEPLSIGSLAKYVLAEMPKLSEIPPELNFDLAQLEADAGVQTGSGRINRVGKIFVLAGEIAALLLDADLRGEWLHLQADPTDWLASQHDMVLDRVGDVASLRRLIAEIGAQGEGATGPADGPPSHFLRFFRLYRTLKEAAAAGPIEISRNVPIDPNLYDEHSAGFIQNPAAASWGDIANQRLRWLFVSIAHHLQADVPSERRMLRSWALEDMRALRDISKSLVSLPQHQPPRVDVDGRLMVAALPFNLPYALSLPIRSTDLWAHHKMLATHELATLQSLGPGSSLAVRLAERIRQRLAFIASL